VADSLFEIGAYKASSVEYEYIYYSYSDNDVKTRALLKKATCYKKLGLFPESLKCLERINVEGLSDSVTYQVLYETALSAFLSNDYGYAELQFIQMKLYVKDSTLINSSQLLYAMTLNEQQKWTEAEKELESYITKSNSSLNDSLTKKIHSLYTGTPKLLNVKKAMRMSSFIPGSGQMYLGYWGDGITNASLQLCSLAFIGYNVLAAQYFTAVTLGTGLLQKFYVGGIHRVKYLGDKKNYERAKKFNEEAKKLIIQISSS